MMQLHQALDMLRAHIPGARLIGDGQAAIARVHTDTRSVQHGDLFVALQGARFDGSRFLAQARAAGAAASIVPAAAASALLQAALPGIAVPDTLHALTVLAAAWRARFAVPLAAIVGSNGKTTVTQMLASILRAHAGAHGALATEGNYNNAIGVPLTLLRLRAHHRLAAVELGMNHPGEIAALAATTCPTVALVNNAQREHQEFLHTVHAVAQENGAVLHALAADGVAVLPAADAFTPLWRHMAGARRCLLFGQAGNGAHSGAQVYTRDARWLGEAWHATLTTPAGAVAIRLRVAGQHNLHNAQAAATCALALHVPLAAIATGLNQFEAVPGRSRTLRLACGALLVDDSYNANPDSVQAAIALLATLPGPRLLVLGDMGEVGAHGARWHRDAGQHARACGIEHLWTVGALAQLAAQAFGPHARHFADLPALEHALCGRYARQSSGSVLVKGSRFMRMDVKNI